MRFIPRVLLFHPTVGSISIRLIKVVLVVLVFSGPHNAKAQTRICSGPLSIQWTDCVGSHVFFWGGRYEGEWKNGRMHGRGKEFAPDGSLQREGNWVEGTYVEGAAKEVRRDPAVAQFAGQSPAKAKPEATSGNATDTPPRLDFNSCVKISYPEATRAKKLIGITSVSYVMNEDGEINDASIMMPSGDTPEHADLDNIFLQAVKGCKGIAGTKLGVRQKHYGRIDYSWILPGANIEQKSCGPLVVPDVVRGGGVSGTTEAAVAVGPAGGLLYAVITKNSGETMHHAQLDHIAWRSIYSCSSVQSMLLRGLPPNAVVQIKFNWTSGGEKPQIIRMPYLNAGACEKPEYTSAARRAEAQGVVRVVYNMNEKGVIDEAFVEASSGPTREHKQLDRGTLEAVKACRVAVPGAIDGVPTRLSGRVEYNWRLTGGSGFDFSSLLMLPMMLLRR
jgi:TonB family protein